MNGYAPGNLLGQARLSNTTAAALYTAVVRTEITRLIVANTTSSASTFRVFHDEGGITYDESNALIWDFSIASGAFFDSLQSYNTGNGITLVPTDTLGIRSGTGNALTFSVYGVLSGVR